MTYSDGQGRGRTARRAAALAGLLGAVGCGNGTLEVAAGEMMVALRDLAASPPGDGALPDLTDRPRDSGPPDPGLRYLAATEPPYTPVDTAPLDAESAMVTAALQAAGGWGAGNKFQIDFSILILTADANTPVLQLDKTGDFFDPDCDDSPMPVPAGGAFEGEDGYACNGDGDCHLIVADFPHNKLYEMWRAISVTNTTLTGGCLAIWDMTRHYPDSGRGEGCTSADAGGFAIASMLPTSDEVWAAVQVKGTLNHALRFILPNARIRANTYVHPGSHTTGSTSGGALLPPYGARLRLRPDYPLASLPNEAARVIARTLMKYGMFLADGGNIALTFEDDRFRTHKWADVAFDSHSLLGIQATDFQMVDGGARHKGFDCVRN